MAYIQKHFGWPVEQMPEMWQQELTYVSTVEVVLGMAVPDSPRERSVLNIVARLPNYQPIASSSLVCDYSQSIAMAQIRNDGALPTVATKSIFWSFADGMQLENHHVAHLHGHRHDDADYKALSDNAFKQALGLGVHVGCIGTAMLSTIAAVCSGASKGEECGTH